MEEYLKQIVAQNKRLIELAEFQIEHTIEVIERLDGVIGAVNDLQGVIITYDSSSDISSIQSDMGAVISALHEVKTAIEDLPDHMPD